MNEEKNTQELILTELIKLNNKFDSLNSEFKGVKEELSELKSEVKTGFTKVDQSFVEMGEAIHFIGNKVFDNHERRIVALEG